MRNHSKTERISDRELVVTRTVHGPAHLVYEAWTKAELFRRWWVPAGAPMTLVACELDVRKGGKYHLQFRFGEGGQTMDFFGQYLEVVPNSRIVWTNDESGDEAGAITTVSFKELNGETLVTVHDLYPSKEALDEAIANGSTSGMPAQLDQLDEMLSNKAS